uniref:hypothetical protein n=1 Tax=Agathobacter sp. TaxID=2021311 RepID=UPI0040579BFD
MGERHIAKRDGEFYRKREKLVDSISCGTDITEDEIKHILRNREMLMASIQDKMYTIRHDIIWTRDVIEMVSLPCKTLSDMPGIHNRHMDIGDVYEKYEKRLNRRRTEFIEMMEALSDKEEKIERVWASYLALDEPYYSIVNRMYVQNELYATVEAESGYSRHVFEKYRKEAVSLIRHFYDSEKSMASLFEMQQCRPSATKRRKPADEEPSGQISLADWLENVNNSEGKKT